MKMSSSTRCAETMDISCKVYIGDLGKHVSYHKLKDVFSAYGRIKHVWVARNPPGFAFVEFEDSKDAEDSVRCLDGTRIGGDRVRVSMANGRGRYEPIGRGRRSRSSSRSSDSSSSETNSGSDDTEAAKVFGQMSMGKFRLRNGSSIFEKLVDDLKRVQNKLNRVARHRRQQRSRSKSPDQSKKHSSRNLPSKSTRSREEGSSGHKESSSRGRRSDKKKRCISRRSRSKSPSTRRSKSRSPSQKKSESADVVSSSKTRSRNKRASPPATDRRKRSADSVSSGDSSKLVIAYSDSPESNDDISDGEFTRWRKKIREQERLSGTKKRRSSTGNPTNTPASESLTKSTKATTAEAKEKEGHSISQSPDHSSSGQSRRSKYDKKLKARLIKTQDRLSQVTQENNKLNKIVYEQAQKNKTLEKLSKGNGTNQQSADKASMEAVTNQSPDLVSRSLLQHRWGVPSAKKASDSKSSGSNGGGGLSKLVIDETGSVTLHKASRSQSPVPRKRPKSQQLQATTDSPEIKHEVIDVETYQPRNERQQLEPIARPNKPIEKTTENNEQPMISPDPAPPPFRRPVGPRFLPIPVPQYSPLPSPLPFLPRYPPYRDSNTFRSQAIKVNTDIMSEAREVLEATTDEKLKAKDVEPVEGPVKNETKGSEVWSPSTASFTDI